MNYDKKENEIIINYQTTIKLHKVTFIHTKIPKVIIQTGNTYEISMAQYNTALTFIELNPEYTYIYFDDNDRINFISKYFDKSVINAYNNLIPGAYKADLFRYCYMYINGGCYFDNKLINRIPIRNLLNEDDEIILSIEIGKKYYNGILISNKNNIIFKNCIDKSTFNINNKLYCSNPLAITGPCLLYKYAKKIKPILFANFNNQYIKIKHKNFVKIIKNNKIFCNCSYYQYYDKYIDLNYYVYLWLMRKIYK
jgi:mannosyltransferase OCH1-like enzyme